MGDAAGVGPRDGIATSHRCPRCPLSQKRGFGRIQLLSAALGEQFHLAPCRESPGDATEGDTFALMAGAGFGQAEDTNQALL